MTDFIIHNVVVLKTTARAVNVETYATPAGGTDRRKEWLPTSQIQIDAGDPAACPLSYGDPAKITIPGWLFAKKSVAFRDGCVVTTQAAAAPVRAEWPTKPLHAPADAVFKAHRPKLGKGGSVADLAKHYAAQRRTKVVAVECCVCSLPLVDAESVEWGTGPTCREKYGHVSKLDTKTRARARKLTWIASTTSDLDVLTHAINGLERLGCPELASRLATNIAEVRVTYADAMIRVETPRYNERLISGIKSLPRRRFTRICPEGSPVPRGGRAPRGSKSIWLVPQEDEGKLWAALTACIGGRFGLTTDGLFQIREGR